MGLPDQLHHVAGVRPGPAAAGRPRRAGRPATLVALLAGLAALMSSGIGVTMVAVVGMAVLVRRGWRVAALQTVPLGLAYLVWHFAIASDGYEQDVSDPLDALRFARTTIAAGFGGRRRCPGWDGPSDASSSAGAFLAWRGRPWGEWRKVAAAPAAMAAGAFVFVLITASGASGSHRGSSGRPATSMFGAAAPARGRRRGCGHAPLAGGRSGPGGVPRGLDRGQRGRLLERASVWRRLPGGVPVKLPSDPRVPLAEQVPRPATRSEAWRRTYRSAWLLDGVRSAASPRRKTSSPRRWRRPRFGWRCRRTHATADPL